MENSIQDAPYERLMHALPCDGLGSMVFYIAEPNVWHIAFQSAMIAQFLEKLYKSIKN